MNNLTNKFNQFLKLAEELGLIDANKIIFYGLEGKSFDEITGNILDLSDKKNCRSKLSSLYEDLISERQKAMKEQK